MCEVLKKNVIIFIDTSSIIDVIQNFRVSEKKLSEFLDRNNIYISELVHQELTELRSKVLSKTILGIGQSDLPNSYAKMEKVINSTIDTLSNRGIECYEDNSIFSNMIKLKSFEKVILELDKDISELKKELMDDNKVALKKKYELFVLANKALILPLSVEDKVKFVSEAKIRYELGISPGYKDEKGDTKKYNDAIIWLHLINHFSDKQDQTVYFYTNDMKDANIKVQQREFKERTSDTNEIVILNSKHLYESIYDIEIPVGDDIVDKYKRSIIDHYKRLDHCYYPLGFDSDVSYHGYLTWESDDIECQIAGVNYQYCELGDEYNCLMVFEYCVVSYVYWYSDYLGFSEKGSAVYNQFCEASIDLKYSDGVWVGDNELNFTELDYDCSVTYDMEEY